MREKHLVISTYNFDPTYLTQIGIPFTIYDQSDQEYFQRKVSGFENVFSRPNVGHSLSNIFEYITENYDSLPDLVIFVKSNVLPRHCTKDYFHQNIENNYFTHLLHLDSVQVDKRHSDYLAPGFFMEVNDSWYAQTKNHKLFCGFNQFYKFLFANNQVPKFLVFSPGACYIVESERIRNYPKSFWQALDFISSYQFFPMEAYMVERALSMIFSSKLILQPWVNDSDSWKKMLVSQLNSDAQHTCMPSIKERIVKRFLP